jgi:phosphoserine phosphatase
LESLILRAAGRGLPVALDFDNSILCGDIGEATMAVLTRRGLLDPRRIPSTLNPVFRGSDGIVMKPGMRPDVTRYYEAYLTPTVHGRADPAPLANAYTWAVEAMTGLRLVDVVNATAEAFACSRPGRLPALEITPGRTAYPAPYFHSEMVELVAELLRHEFDVWIVSASNVWSVRYMVIHGLNPLLQERGVRAGLPPDHVLGASTLLTNRRKELLKDTVLVRASPSYARLHRAALADLRLTSRLQFPVPLYSGKVAAIWDALARSPYLCVGDSSSDHAMLTFSQHRLWIARLENPELQAATVRLIRRTEPRSWMVQPVLLRDSPGFVSDFNAAAKRLGRVPANIRAACRHLASFVPD